MAGGHLAVEFVSTSKTPETANRKKSLWPPFLSLVNSYPGQLILGQGPASPLTRGAKTVLLLLLLLLGWEEEPSRGDLFLFTGEHPINN